MQWGLKRAEALAFGEDCHLKRRHFPCEVGPGKSASNIYARCLKMSHSKNNLRASRTALLLRCCYQTDALVVCDFKRVARSRSSLALEADLGIFPNIQVHSLSMCQHMLAAHDCVPLRYLLTCTCMFHHNTEYRNQCLGLPSGGTGGCRTGWIFSQEATSETRNLC